eukprot:7892535-Ditylum_brightwellii.AAC.1
MAGLAGGSPARAQDCILSPESLGLNPTVYTYELCPPQELGYKLTNVFTMTGYPDSEPYGHVPEVHPVHTGLVGQTGSVRQLKLPEGHPRPGWWHISFWKEKNVA